MLKEKMEAALNRQVNAELFAAYLYQSMSAYFHSQNLAGFAHWLQIQVQEELTHVMRIYNYIIERGGRVKLEAIDAPPVEWESPLDAFEAAYGHEVKVTGMINSLVDLAAAEKDHATNNFLQWFVAEQVEEEASADDAVQKLKLATTDGGGGMFLLDREMAGRVFNVPPDLKL